uniref:Uncharacterized protein n=1 Tax=Anguilla anguilla TaxID=7936 RepID=A0A0E9VBM2_ANGAN
MVAFLADTIVLQTTHLTTHKHQGLFNLATHTHNTVFWSVQP